MNDARAYALEMDRQDRLASFRTKFYIADPELIYLDGNSLGRLPQQTLAEQQALTQKAWGERLIRSWNEGWFDLPERLGAQIAPLVGAQPDEIIVADSTSINLFKLALAAMQKQQGRHNIVTDDLNFPSDIYIFDSVAKLCGGRVEIVPSDGVYGPVTGLEAAVDQATALLSLSHTAFKSSYTYDMAAISALAHRHGALVLWDLSHSAGALPISLNESGADLAVGCTYKYLNGGPGAPAFLYIRRDLQEQLFNPISGWMGEKRPFEFQLDYQPAQGLRRFLTGTPPILSLLPMVAGIQLLQDAGMDNIRQKSAAQTTFLTELYNERLAQYGFTYNSPQDVGLRGSHIAFGHPDGLGIARAMIEDMKVIPDFRAPDNIRLGIAPLYNRFIDIYEAVSRLQQIMEQKLYQKYMADVPAVT